MSNKNKRRRCQDWREWKSAAIAVSERYEAMGFRHDAARAQGAKEVLLAMGCKFVPGSAHTVVHVNGLTQVTESE